MCPLRYIVFLVSALIAIFLLVWQQRVEDDELVGDDGEKLGKINSFFDFFNGRYIYNFYKAYRKKHLPVEPEAKAQVEALQSKCPMAHFHAKLLKENPNAAASSGCPMAALAAAASRIKAE